MAQRTEPHSTMSAVQQICQGGTFLGADLPMVDFFRGRFAEGRVGKGPICPAPVFSGLCVNSTVCFCCPYFYKFGHLWILIS